MATRGESNVVYAAGLVQGVALVTFPAASSVFLDPSTYGLTSTQYGWMFLPQVVLAIIASLLGANLATRFGAKRLLRAGLAGNLVAMILLVFSRSLTATRQWRTQCCLWPPASSAPASGSPSPHSTPSRRSSTKSRPTAPC
jgi:MFS family permease